MRKAAASGGDDDAMRKLMELRMRMNEARKRNHSEVVAEDRRAHKTPAQLRAEATAAAAASAATAAAASSSSASAGRSGARGDDDNDDEHDDNKDGSERKQRDPVRERLMATTALDAEYLAKKERKKEKGRAKSGWEVFNTDTTWRAHDKRVKALVVDRSVAEKQKAEIGEDAYYSGGVGGVITTQPKDDPDRVNAMVIELVERERVRNQFSRRRRHHPDQDVTFINDNNANFNKKLSRHFDKYTAEVRQNLERGTAL